MTDLGNWLLFLHVGGAMVWVGGGVMLSLVASRALASGDPALVREFGRSLQFLSLRSLAPAMLIVLLAGIALVIVRSRSFEETWVRVGLAGFLAAFLVGVAYLSRVGIALQRATRADPVDVGAARDAIGRWILGYRAMLVILVLVFWDMVFKPGL